MMKTLKLTLLAFFSLAFLGQQSVYAQGASMAELSTLQTEEARLLSENKSLKQKIKTTKAQIEKKKKTIRRGAIIGSIGAVAGAGGLLFAKGRKHKTAQVEEQIALQKERPELIEKIVKLAAKLCAIQGEKDCELTYNGFDLAEGIDDLSDKTLIELRTRYADLQRWEEYHNMVVFLAERGSCKCLKLKTCEAGDNVDVKTLDELISEYQGASLSGLKKLYRDEKVKEKLEKEINDLYLKLEIEYKNNSENLSALETIGRPKCNEDENSLRKKLSDLEAFERTKSENAKLADEVKAYQNKYPAGHAARTESSLTACFVNDAADMTPDKLEDCKKAFRAYEINAQRAQTNADCINQIKDAYTDDINDRYAPIFIGETLPALDQKYEAKETITTDVISAKMKTFNDDCQKTKEFYKRMQEVYQSYDTNKKTLDKLVKQMKDLKDDFPGKVFPSDLNVSIPTDDKIKKDAVKTKTGFERAKELDYDTPIKDIREALKKTNKAKKETEKKEKQQEKANSEKTKKEALVKAIKETYLDDFGEQKAMMVALFNTVDELEAMDLRELKRASTAWKNFKERRSNVASDIKGKIKNGLTSSVYPDTEALKTKLKNLATEYTTLVEINNGEWTAATATEEGE